MKSVTFDPPGPGEWMLDTTHHGRRPVTWFMRDLYLDGFEKGFSQFTKKFGLPLETMKGASVHGYFYARPKPVGEPAKPGPTPPMPVLWVLSRLHPELRRRTKAAAAAWEQQLWRKDVDDWFGKERSEVIARNRAFQRVEVDELDDAGLAEHLDELIVFLAEQYILGFVSHGGDIVPVGDLLAHCRDWGIEAAEVAPLLSGASPQTTETRELLRAAAVAVGRMGDPPGSVEAVRAVSPEADAAVAHWLELHGWRLLNSDDIDCPTLAEQPRLQLGILTNLDPEEPEQPAVDPAAVRERVPADRRSLFDQLLADARYGLRLRDDNVGVRLNWPAGLVRRAVLTAGRRLASAGRLQDPEHVFCVLPAELQAMLRTGGGPTAAEVAARAEEREFQKTLDPPSHLGEPEAPPPLAALPAPMARVTAAVMALIDAMEGAPSGTALKGTGVGGASYTGRACVISSPEDDFSRIAPGDVLIAPFTSPSFNSVLPLLGAIAVQEGGVLSHTAIVAREFGIPAIVGIEGLLAEIRDGETVEVDSASGVVRPVDR